MMIVGLLVIHPRLLIFGGQVYLLNGNSLKVKRQILLSIKSRLKNKFNISISELRLLRLLRSLPATDRQADGQVDSWKESQIGISRISNSGQYIDKELSYISERVKSYPNVEVIEYSTEKI